MQDIAIIGLSIKFPGDGNTPESFWSMLKEKRCVSEEWPVDRFNLEAYANRNSAGFVPGAHFMKEDCGLFDSAFFGISGTEACAMDPQTRLLLETAYRALENAGIPIESVNGTKTAVMNGCMADDYRHIIAHDPDFIPKYAAVGSTACMLANRVSWFFNFHGPSVNLDSACSSSLMALDLACQSLRNGDSSMALVTGSNIIIGIEPILSLMNMGFTSPDGRCFSFDTRANGYGRGEGVGVLVIKRLEDALHDGNTIRAVIRSTGSNQDGYTPGLTQPSKEAQARLILDTYQKAGLNRGQTRFFEAHGTGTAIGDPIEADAIGSVFRTFRSPSDPLYIGAVKSNIGHLEGASGIAGIVKTILVLEKGLIPPNANFEHLNLSIDAEFLNLRIPTELVTWPSKGLRRASVASFGFGGSNAHAILDDAYHYLQERGLSGYHCTVPDPSTAPENNFISGTAKDTTIERIANFASLSSHSTDILPSQLLVFSTEDQTGVERMINAYAQFFEQISLPSRDDDSFLERFATTLALRRSKLSWRAFAIADTYDSLRELPSVVSKPVRTETSLGLGYIFTGQGAQYYQMGADLFKYAACRKTFDACQDAFASFGSSWSIYDALNDPDTTFDINDPKYAQPLTTALQIALIELLSSFGLEPRMVVGHSSGEIAAAYAMGGLSLVSACKVAYFRGALASSLRACDAAAGAMLAVDLSATKTQPYLDRVKTELGENNIHIACTNSPSNVTVSGQHVAIDQLKSILDKEKIPSYCVRTGVAYHTSQMQQIAGDYAKALSGLSPRTESASHGPGVTMISSVTGRGIENPEVLCTPAYWVENMISPVKFSEAISHALSQSGKSRGQRHKKLGAMTRHWVSDWLEIGPHSALKRPFHENLSAAARGNEDLVRYSSILNRHLPAVRSLQITAGRLFSLGYKVALAEVNQNRKEGGFEEILTKLPEYPFNHTKRYWFETEATKNVRLRSHRKQELVGTPMPDSTPLESKWRKVFDATDAPWLLDHAVNGRAIYPATGMIVMAIEGARQLEDNGRTVSGYFLHDSTFHNPITIKPGEQTVTQLHMRPSRQNLDQFSHSYDFQVYTEAGGRWQSNCRGQISIQYASSSDVAAEHAGANTALVQLQHEMAFYRQKLEAAQQQCSIHVPTSKVYKTFEGNGLRYGSSFQVLDDLQWDGERISTGHVKPFPWTSEQSDNPLEPHIVHPATIDGLGQLGWVALTRGGEKIVTTGLVSTRVREAWISSSGASAPQTDLLRAYAHSRFKGLRGTDTSVFALDGAGQLRLWISGMETTSMSSNNAVVAREAVRRDLCFSIDWKPDLTLLTGKRLQAYYQASLENGNASESNRNELDLLLVQYARRVVQRMSTRARSGLPLHLQKYVEWLKQMLGRTSPNDRSLKDHSAIQILEDHILSAVPQARLYVTIGRQLESILDGTVESRDILYSNNGLAAEHRQLTYDQIFENHDLHRYIDALAHKHPQMRILEINAGTGSMAPHLVKALARLSPNGTETHRFSHYDYTDKSDAYFAQARESFASLGRKIAYRHLDIEEDPEKQGFQLGSYDLVVAALPFDCRQDPGCIIDSAWQLLRPDGKLFILDVLRTGDCRPGFAFGTLSEWWEEDEQALQICHFLSEQHWGNLLLSKRFSGLDLVFARHMECSLLVTTATAAPDPSCRPKRTVFVVHPDSQLQALVVSLVSGLDHKKEYTIQVCSVDDIRKLSSTDDDSLVVFLPEIEKPLLVDLDETTYSLLHGFFCQAQNIVWVTAASEHSPYAPQRHIVDGLARVLCTENDRLSFVTAHLDDHTSDPAIWATHIYHILGARHAQNKEARELDYQEQDGVLHVGRIVEAQQWNDAVYEQTQAPRKMRPFKQNAPLTCVVANPGSVDSKSMVFVEDSERTNSRLCPGEVEIEVKAVGVNFRDVFVLLGRLSDGDTIGCECAGVVTRVGAECPAVKPGDYVCAVVLGCVRTLARCDYRFVAKIPRDLGFALAAAIPLGGITAHYSLVKVARLQRNESVLIHSGAGGTGQMAIQVAQALGAKVFVTVGSDEKRELVEKLYEIPRERIFFSRDTSFQRHVMRLTEGRGVDVVLNSLSGDGLIASWECVAPYGRFVELGKSDIESNSKLPMRNFGRNVSFSVVAVDQMQHDRPDIIQESLSLVVEMVAAGTLQPAQPLQEFPLAAAEDAFRLMQSGRNMGKLVLNLNPTDLVQTSIRHTPGYYFSPEATYLVAGGLGGLGRSAARWMASMGAKNLILLSRSGPKSAAAQELLQELNEQGIRVRAPKCDLTCSNALAGALDQCRDLPPIRGCIQGTMVLQDTIFERLTFQQWDTTLQAKVRSTENLHAQLPADLDFFILLSSLAGIIGTVSQANYAAGNTFQDAFAAYRRSIGQRAVALNLGWMREVGIVAEQERYATRADNAPSMATINEAEFLALLERCCDPAFSQDTSSCAAPQSISRDCSAGNGVPQVLVGVVTPAHLRTHHLEVPTWLTDRCMFHTLQQEEDPLHNTGSPDARTATDSADASPSDWHRAFLRADSPAAAASVVVDGLTRKLAKSLSLSAPGEIDLQRSLALQGVDSLLAVELRQWISRAFAAELSALDITSAPTLEELAGMVVSYSEIKFD